MKSLADLLSSIISINNNKLLTTITKVQACSVVNARSARSLSKLPSASILKSICHLLLLKVNWNYDRNFNQFKAKFVRYRIHKLKANQSTHLATELIIHQSSPST